MKTLTMIVMLFITLGLNAQTFELKGNQSITGNADTVTMTVQGVDFNVVVSSTGNHYVIRTSKKTGNDYKQYLGYKTGHDLNSQPVFTNAKQTEYWILGLTSNRTLKKLPVTMTP